MSCSYYPTPARSEPATVSGRSLSSDADIATTFEIHAHTARLRPTRSVPASFPTDRSTLQQRRSGVGLGLGLPTTLAARFHPRPERPRLQRQAGLGLGTPFTAIPTRTMRRRVAGTFSMSPAARSRSGQHGLGLSMHRENAPNPGVTEPENVPHPAITLTLADAFESEDSEDDAPRYSFLPPGLSSPVPWPSSPVGQDPPSVPSVPAASPTVRPMMFRRLASPGIRAALASDAPPPAPLSPSIGSYGAHHHFPGLDHSAGGPADDDALVEMEVARPSRSWRRMPPTAPPAPRMAWVERFTNDRLYH